MLAMQDRMRRVLLIGVLIGGCGFAAQRLVSIDGRRLSIDCEGIAGNTPVVVLMAGGGRTAKDWSEVLPAVAKFARVCSYDRAGLGESDNPPGKTQSADEIVDDLRRLLAAVSEKGPYILVAHSASGIFARRFAATHPAETAGLVMVDSSHEEQLIRRQELNPQDPPPVENAARRGFLIKPGARLEWHTNVPMIVLCHGKSFPHTAEMSEEKWAAWERIWREMQEDLAKRSPRAEFRVAEKSGHFIQRDQPELVIQAIRDVLRATL